MMYDVSTICKYQHALLWADLIFPVENLKLHFNCLSFFKQIPCQIVHIFSYPVAFLPFLDFWYFTIYLLFTTILLRKALSVKQHIKTSVGTRKCPSEFCLEVPSIEFDIKLLPFLSFERFTGIKIYKTFDALLPLTQNLLIKPFSYCIPLFRLFIIQLFIASNMIVINFFFLKRLF